MAGGNKFLAFDLGAESGRAIAGFLDGYKLRLEVVHRFPNIGVAVGNGMHWDVLRLFHEMKQGLRLAVQQHGSDICGAGVDTWGVDFGLLGPNDVLLENPHCYRDPRNDGMIAEAEKIVPRAELYEETGIQIMPFNTIFQLLSVARENPWMLDTAETMLMMPDLFNFWFTGVKAGEFSEATTSQCYNPRTGDWARPLMDRLNIPSHFLPNIIQPGTVLGNLRGSICGELGVPEIPFIAPATHDTGSAVAAVPAVGSGHIYISSGTWSLMGIESPTPIINETTSKLNFTNEGGVAGTYRVLRNIAGLWLVQECRRTWALAGKEYTYSQLTEMASTAEPYRSIIDPDDAVFGKPGDMPTRIREFCKRTNQPVPESEGAVVRTALDSLAMRYRWVAEHLDNLTGQRLSPIHIVGGGTQNTLLCQLAADVTGRTVLAGPIEATAIGNVVVQAIGLGYLGSLSDARQIIRDSFNIIRYESQSDSRIEDAYAKFLSLIG